MKKLNFHVAQSDLSYLDAEVADKWGYLCLIVDVIVV